MSALCIFLTVNSIYTLLNMEVLQHNNGSTRQMSEGYKLYSMYSCLFQFDACNLYSGGPILLIPSAVLHSPQLACSLVAMVCSAAFSKSPEDRDLHLLKKLSSWWSWNSAVRFTVLLIINQYFKFNSRAPYTWHS